MILFYQQNLLIGYISKNIFSLQFALQFVLNQQDIKVSKAIS